MGYKGYVQDLVRAYKKVSRLTGFSIEELARNCLGVIKEGRHAGRIGILENQTRQQDKETYSVRFQPKRKRVDFKFDTPFGEGWKSLEEKFYYSPNVFLILEEQAKLLKQKYFFKR